jgi:CheY-like chemotaxis protein
MEAWSVLVVDDEPAHRAVLSLVVEHDTRVTLAGVADDGRAAIDLVHQRCPDAIILDVRMPHMDGLTALPRLRQACPRSVIVMYSSDPQAANPALDHGADLVADKTEAPITLLDRIVELCATTRDA